MLESSILMVCPSGSQESPLLDDVPLSGGVSGRFAVVAVQLRSDATLGDDQSGRFEHAEMLGAGLPGRPEAVLGDEERTELEKGLPVVHRELVDDESLCLTIDGSEHVSRMAAVCK